MCWLLVATISFVLNTNIIFLILLSNTKVTGVGTNTEWGMLMANLSEDVGEETPLQVSFLRCLLKRDVGYVVLISIGSILMILAPTCTEIGAFEWCRYSYWYCGFVGCCCSSSCALDKVCLRLSCHGHMVYFTQLYSSSKIYFLQGPFFSPKFQIFYWTYQEFRWDYSICGWNNWCKTGIYGGN